MGKAEDPRRGITFSTPEDGGTGCLGRALVTFVVVAVILLVTAVFAVRTEGARSFLEDQIEKRLGMEVTLGGARIGWPYDLVLRDIASENGGGSGDAAFKAEEWRIGVSWCGAVRMTIRRGDLRLVPDADGAWKPQAFSRLGSLPEGSLAELSRLTGKPGRRSRVRLEQGSIHWFGADGSQRAGADGIHFETSPVKAGERRMTYYSLLAYNVLMPDGSRLNDVSREWLSSDVAAYIEIYADGDTGSGASGVFWNPARVSRVERRPSGD